MSNEGGAQKINREAQQVAVGDGNARKLVPGGLDGSRSGWRVSSAHVVPEHPPGHRASTWVTERPRGSLSVHVCHCRLDRAHGGGTLRLIQRSLGAGGQIRLCILASCDCDGAATGRVGGR